LASFPDAGIFSEKYFSVTLFGGCSIEGLPYTGCGTESPCFFEAFDECQPETQMIELLITCCCPEKYHCIVDSNIKQSFEKFDNTTCFVSSVLKIRVVTFGLSVRHLPRYYCDPRPPWAFSFLSHLLKWCSYHHCGKLLSFCPAKQELPHLLNIANSFSLPTFFVLTSENIFFCSHAKYIHIELVPLFSKTKPDQN
jgi:hypothetical protein